LKKHEFSYIGSWELGRNQCEVYEGKIIGLNLANLELINCPEVLTQFKNLRALNLENNAISEIPKSFINLTLLNNLKLRDNNFREFPAILKNLKSLQSLQINHKLSVKQNHAIFLEEIEDQLNKKISYVTEIGIVLKPLENVIVSDKKFFEKIGGIPETCKPGIKTRGYSVTGLGLNDLGLKEVPVTIGNLDTLEELWLGNLGNLPIQGNDLKTLPTTIGKLKELRNLDLRCNFNLGTLPNEIGELSSLKILNLSRCKIEYLPDSISKLKALETLDIGMIKSYSTPGKLATLPKTFSNLISLKNLDLAGNEISELPDSIGNLKSLKYLKLHNNLLRVLPDSFGELTSLEILELHQNLIEYLPHNFGNLKALKKLNLSNNELKILPKSFENLNLLKKLNLNYNSFETLPEFFCKLSSLKKVEIVRQFLKIRNNKGKLDKSILKLPKHHLMTRTFIRLPKNFGDLSSLKEVNLRGNLLISLPDSFANLDLIELDISDNKFKEIPPSLGSLNNLMRLSLEMNPFEEDSQKFLERYSEKEHYQLRTFIKKSDIPILLEFCQKRRGSQILKRLKSLASENTFNIFLSYSTLDTEFFQIYKITKELKNHPAIDNVFYWEGESSQNVVEYMEQAIKLSKILILFCSENANESQSVKAEWQAAFQLMIKGNVKIIPVYSSKEQVPILLLPLINVHYEKSNFHKFIYELITEILRK